MRRLLLQVPAGAGRTVLQRAEACGGVNLARLDGRGARGAVELVVVHLPNDRVESLLHALDDVDDVEVTVDPHGVLPLRPPLERAADQLLEVEPRSALEVVLAGMQAAGSWPSFLGFALASGVVVWIGLYTEIWYLLTAAMLIAPFAGPAMNTAIGTARGDLHLVRHGVLRYAAGLAVGAVASGALTLLVGHEVPTRTAVELSEISSISVLLPIAAGFAGGLFLVQSEHASLISGASVGMLVAASLAPPVGILGMGAVLGEGELVTRTAFLLVLQLVGINVTAVLVFRRYGVSTRGPLVGSGSRWVVSAGLAVSAVALVGLVAWQIGTGSTLQRSSQARELRQVIAQDLAGGDTGELVDVDVRFGPLVQTGQDWLLVTVHIVGDGSDESEITEATREQVLDVLRGREIGGEPVVDVVVVQGRG